MKPLRQVVIGLMALSGVTHVAQFLLREPSPDNTTASAVVGLILLVLAGILLRPGPLGLWLGLIIGGIAAVFGGLIAAGTPTAPAIFHALVSALIALLCLYLLFRLQTKRIALAITSALLFGAAVMAMLLIVAISQDPFAVAYDEHCAQCHGDNLEGMPIGPALVGSDLVHGDSVAEIQKSIAVGFPANGMPGWSATLDEGQIHALALLIAEKRLGFSQTELRVKQALAVPEGPIESELRTFRVESVAVDLHPRPFSIAPLPDGRILVSEKTRGLSFISAEGEQSELIQGTPPAHADGVQLPVTSLIYGMGWLMDVALHPDYEKNGWIYLHFGDRCRDCDTSMNKLIRARIEDGRWVDEETVWQAAPETYTGSSDMGAGGRISFDDEGHVFLSIGIKGENNYHGIQDLGLPYGKIHRVHDDGKVPADNPFVEVAGALPSTWTYGHRSPQGLEFDPQTGRLWSTEMGPRGGDELNLLAPGKNYGWPLYSLGMDYDGTPVEYGNELGITLDLDAIEQPIVDMTPAPAVSSFIIYRGDLFPEWRNNFIVGTLKAGDLYRWVLDGERVVHKETLIEGIGRIRDVEMATDGAIYLLLEHASGGQIVRMVPE